MEEKKTASPSIVKLALVLLAVSAITALILGFVNHVTKDKIAEIAADKTATAYANVLEAANYVEIDPAAYQNDGTITRLTCGTDANGTPIGYVAETYFSGAQGMITMVVGLDMNKTCTGIYITKSSETAGLGALASETQPGAWRDNIVGETMETNLSKDGGTIEAISGATITSRAVVTEVHTVIQAVTSLG